MSWSPFCLGRAEVQVKAKHKADIRRYGNLGGRKVAKGKVRDITVHFKSRGLFHFPVRGLVFWPVESPIGLEVYLPS